MIHCVEMYKDLLNAQYLCVVFNGRWIHCVGMLHIYLLNAQYLFAIRSMVGVKFILESFHISSGLCSSKV